MYAGTRVKKRTGNNRGGKYIHIRNISIHNACLGTVIIIIFLFDSYTHYTVFKIFENYH